MNKQILHTVEGLRDIHPLDTRKKQHIEQKILNVFNQYGYEQVQTPMFEYFDIYQYERGTEDSKNLYKFFNREGDILSLRPDVTPSIARYTATFYNHENSPKRFAYLGNVFYNNENYQGKLREYTQAGVECIGIGNADADAESIALAINALLATGLQEFQLDIGHAGFFKGLATEAGLSDDLREEVRSLIDAKNYIALEELLEDLKIQDNAKKGLLELPRLFGQEEILERAKELTTNATALEAIHRVKAVYDILKEYKLSSYVSFDLGMVSQLQYYTGIIFKGFTYGTGVSVVDGGRYDALLSTFAYNMPAVGFAIRIDELLNAIMRQNIAIDVPSINTLIVYNKSYRKVAIELAQVLRRQEMTVELDTKNQSLDVAKAYGKQKNIGGIMYINAPDTVQLINLSTDEINTVNLSDLSKGGPIMRYLTFALAKGQLAKKALKLLEEQGITCEEMYTDTRKLIFVNEELKLKFFLAKASDVPTYVEYGAADIGVVGKDTILEERRNLYEVVDLGFGKCDMVVAGPKAMKEQLKYNNSIRVATKYPNIAKDYFYNKKIKKVEIIKLNGSIELAPLVGLSEVIVDIVETGTTLKENGLVVLETICPLSARMIVNRVSMKMESERINAMITQLRKTLQ